MALHANIRFRSKPALHEKLKQAADANHRSLNAEMLERLDRSFQAKELKDIVRDALRESNDRAKFFCLGHAEGFGG